MQTETEAQNVASRLQADRSFGNAKFVVRKIGYFWEVEQYGPGKFWRIVPQGRA